MCDQEPEEKAVKGGAKAKPASAKGGKGSRPGTASSSADGEDPTSATSRKPKKPVPSVFPPSLNETWGRCLAQMEQLLAPLMPAIRQAIPTLPEVPAGPPATPPPGAKGAAAKKGAAEEEAKAPVGHKVLLLIDPELKALPFEALPHLRSNCSSVARCPSLHLLHVAAQAAASPDDATAPPSFDVTGGITYIVDPKCEGSSPEDAKGPFSPPLISTFQSRMLDEFKDWKGFVGSPNRVPADADLMQLVSSASSLVFLGMGRFMSYISPAIISSVDLRGCDVAILMARVNNTKAHQRQLYLDNRKSQVQRQLESPMRTAELLLARGVKTVITTAMATTAESNLDMLRAIFTHLQGGATVAEAVWQTLLAYQFELDHVASGLVVMGLPHMVAGGGGAGKGAKGGKKK